MNKLLMFALFVSLLGWAERRGAVDTHDKTGTENSSNYVALSHSEFRIQTETKIKKWLEASIQTRTDVREALLNLGTKAIPILSDAKTTYPNSTKQIEQLIADIKEEETLKTLKSGVEKEIEKALKKRGSDIELIIIGFLKALSDEDQKKISKLKDANRKAHYERSQSEDKFKKSVKEHWKEYDKIWEKTFKKLKESGFEVEILKKHPSIIHFQATVKLKDGSTYPITVDEDRIEVSKDINIDPNKTFKSLNKDVQNTKLPNHRRLSESKFRPITLSVGMHSYLDADPKMPLSQNLEYHTGQTPPKISQYGYLKYHPKLHKKAANLYAHLHIEEEFNRFSAEGNKDSKKTEYPKEIALNATEKKYAEQIKPYLGKVPEEFIRSILKYAQYQNQLDQNMKELKNLERRAENERLKKTNTIPIGIEEDVRDNIKFLLETPFTIPDDKEVYSTRLVRDADAPRSYASTLKDMRSLGERAKAKFDRLIELPIEPSSPREIRKKLQTMERVLGWAVSDMEKASKRMEKVLLIYQAGVNSIKGWDVEKTILKYHPSLKKLVKPEKKKPIKPYIFKE